MTDVSTRLKLEYLLASQADKHVAVNSALSVLDSVVQLTVVSHQLAAPPLNPSDGACYIVPPSSTSEWATRDGQIAIWQDNNWTFAVPLAGWRAAVATQNHILIFDGVNWVDLKVRSADQLGVNASADATNRLSVSAHASLLSHEGGDHRLKVNKATTAHTASIVFQNDYSGRAEIGLLGNNQFGLKTSSNGVNFTSAISVDPITGFVGIRTDTPMAPLHISRGVEHIIHKRIDNSASGCGMVSRKARGSVGALVALQTGDVTASFVSGGYDGAIFLNNGILRWVVDGTVDLNIVPTRLEIHTAQNDGILKEQMRVTKDGSVGIGTTTPTCRLHVAGAMRLEPLLKANLPNPSNSGAGAMVFVTDEAGGSVLAFSDGTAWRRVTDRATVA